MENITWELKSFDDLKPAQLYAMLRLRTEVFVVEQNCVFQDLDNKDQKSVHLFGWRGEQLLAYTRLVPPGISYDEPSIGRVVTSPVARGTGLGKVLMQKSIKEAQQLFGVTSIRIGAQLYLRAFYQSLGFEQSSDIYDEDGIDHIEMVRPAILFV
jgi:ElaA protein